ncbi:nucleotide exchange factor GrpE [Pendulispora rubella]|uniref:Protein GrpE n=1 Tax=Pendulispora rubella TaxID=2741070 RepID=A0ABZ2L6T7_9BACT
MTEKDVSRTENGNVSPELETEAEALLEAEEAPAEDPLAQAQLEAARLKDMWMRTAAEFDNFRKRSRREADDARKQGREDILRELLPVFDNLERGVQSAQRAQDVKAVIDGMQMILKQFEQTLGKLDIKKVPAVGTPFDPTVHEAIQQVETDQHPSGTVIFEVQPGYIQGDKLLRAAMVVVAKAPAGKGPGDDGNSAS